MGFSCLGRDYVREGYTQIDNVFLSKYLADADAIDVKVYLYGLMLASSERENTLERLAYNLRLTEERILHAYSYWEDLGLVSVKHTPELQVTYNSVKMPLSKTVLFNAREYSEFVDELRRIFPEKIIPEGDIIKYVETMKTYHLEQNAMLLIARYCRDKRGTTNTASVLGLAASWAKQGLTTMELVNEKLDELERDTEDMRLIYKELGLKSTPAVEDYEAFTSWIKNGFTLDAVLTAARVCKKKGGMSKLSRLMDELRAVGALTATDVDSYQKEKEEIRLFTGEVIRTIGSYYATLEMPIETYVNPWLKLGYEKNAILAIAKFCFLRNVKTLDGMQVVIDKFYKLGIVTLEGINAYVQRQAKIDASIKEVLEAANAEPFVSNRDREFYRAFIEDWGFDHEVVLEVARNATGKPFPMSYVNKILLVFKQNGVYSLDSAKAFFANGGFAKKKASLQEDIIKQEYTQEQLSSVFRDIDDIDLDDIII